MVQFFPDTPVDVRLLVCPFCFAKTSIYYFQPIPKISHEYCAHCRAEFVFEPDINSLFSPDRRRIWPQSTFLSIEKQVEKA